MRARKHDDATAALHALCVDRWRWRDGMRVVPDGEDMILCHERSFVSRLDNNIRVRTEKGTPHYEMPSRAAYVVFTKLCAAWTRGLCVPVAWHGVCCPVLAKEGDAFAVQCHRFCSKVGS